MSEQDEWRQWSESWQRQPVVDVQRLQRQVRNKRWRIMAMVAIETFTTLAAMWQLQRLMHHFALGLRWQIFCIGASVLLPVLWGLSLWLRRGTLRASGESVVALMRLAERRARAGIRLARVGLCGLAVLVGFVVVLAWPQLQPASWLRDPKLRLLLIAQIALNGPLVVATVAFNLWYIRRQRRRLQRIARFLGAPDASD
ncbi:MAG TPA: hypothetical protein VFW82_07455 [Dyella sp.]|nr:hypothetical protein [Dyella sp.]